MPSTTTTTNSSTTSRTYASGTVNKNTQNQLNKYSGDYKQSAAVTNLQKELAANKTYKQSDAVTNAYNQLQANSQYTQGDNVTEAYRNLQNVLSNQPGAFQSSYTDQLNDIYQQVLNRPAFSYDFNTDALYQTYRDRYMAAGKQAMQDTQAQAAALTGGYGNSYAQTAGQQQYQAYLQQLNDQLPTLYQQAYNRYQDEGDRLNNLYQLANNQYQNEYSQYRDQVNDWQSDRAYAQGAYTDARDFDYNKFAADRSFYQQQYEDERNFDYNKFSDYRNLLYNMYSDERNFDYSKWNNDRSYWTQEYWNEKNSAQTTESKTNTVTVVTTPDAVSGGGGGGGGGRRSSGSSKSTKKEEKKSTGTKVPVPKIGGGGKRLMALY